MKSLGFKREKKIVFRIFCDSQTSMEIVDPQKCSEKGKQHLKVGGIGKSFVMLLHCLREKKAAVSLRLKYAVR